MLKFFSRVWMVGSFFIVLGLIGDVEQGGAMWELVQAFLILVSWFPAIRLGGLDQGKKKAERPALARRSSR